MVYGTKPRLIRTKGSFDFVHHVVYRQGESLPPISSHCLYEVVLASNGVFVRSERTGLRATIPVLSTQEEERVRGLNELQSEVRLEKRVSRSLTETMLSVCMNAMPNECLMWLGFEDSEYHLTIPPQDAGRVHVEPLSPYQREGAGALLDLHSHNSMPPIFSMTDDRDEIGFRLFAVVGLLDNLPSISVRVGVFGHFAIVPAESIFDLPDWLSDYCSIIPNHFGSGLLSHHSVGPSSGGGE